MPRRYKPTRERLQKTLYGTETFVKSVRPELPVNMRCYAQTIQDGCKKIRTRLTQS